MGVFTDNELHTKLDAITKRLDHIDDRLDQLSPLDELAAVRKELGELKQAVDTVVTDSTVLEDLRKSIKSIDSLNTRYEKRVNALHSFETNTARVLAQRMEKTLTEKLRFIESMYTQYQELSKNLTTVQKTVQVLQPQIDKFVSISKTIKEKDFTLAQHARNLEKKDRDIRRVERENDKLKTMIGRNRRSRTPSR